MRDPTNLPFQNKCYQITHITVKSGVLPKIESKEKTHKTNQQTNKHSQLFIQKGRFLPAS